MDKLEKRLQADAEDIRADVSSELSSRLDASIAATDVLPAAANARGSSATLWWTSSLTGLAAAMLILFLVNLNRESAEVVAPESYPATPIADIQAELPVFLPLTASTAELTEPLEDELKKLQADLETARDTVARDLRSSF